MCTEKAGALYVNHQGNKEWVCTHLHQKRWSRAQITAFRDMAYEAMMPSRAIFNSHQKSGLTRTDKFHIQNIAINAIKEKFGITIEPLWTCETQPGFNGIDKMFEDLRDKCVEAMGGIEIDNECNAGQRTEGPWMIVRLHTGGILHLNN